MATKFSEWVFNELPELPDQQILSTDSLVVIRGGIPYASPLNSRYAYGSLNDNVLETTINAMDVWESIAGVLVPSGAELEFAWFGNVLSYLGDDLSHPILLTFDFSVMKTGGPVDTDVIQLGIFENGTLEGIGVSNTIENSHTISGSLTLPIVLEQGDTFEPMVRNRTNGDNVTVIDMQVTVT